MKLKKYDMTEFSDKIDGQSLLDFTGRSGARIRLRKVLRQRELRLDGK